MTDTNIAPDQVVGSEIQDGLQIQLTTAFQLLHQGTPSNSGEVWDVVTVESCNIDVVDRVETLGWGGQASKDQVMHTLAPREGRVPTIIKGRLKRGLPLWGKASANNAVNVYVEVGVLEATETV